MYGCPKGPHDAAAPFALSLHHLSALDVSHADLIIIAGALRVDYLCMFTYVPERARHLYPCIDPSQVALLRDTQASAGATLSNLEVFPLDGKEDWAGFARGLEIGAALGATRATAHIHNASDHETAVARFAAFCDMAAPYGIAPGLEFNAFSSVHSIQSASAIVRDAARGNANLVCDMLHLVRNGGGPADVAAAADIIGYAQINDGPLDRRDLAATAPQYHDGHRSAPDRGV
jgi:sugar phosphate isomerase/epimerase